LNASAAEQPAQPATDRQDQDHEPGHAEPQVAPPAAIAGSFHKTNIDFGRPAVEGLIATLELLQGITDKLERAVFLRWPDDRGDSERADAIADERAALTAELTLLSGPVIRQLSEAELR
jgi:hypothetical protein